MDPQILRELETAAQILLAPPNLVNNEQRHAAEAVFMNFRKARKPYAMCKQILETSSVDYVLFEVANLIKTAIVKEWRMLQENDKISLREYLFNYVVERSLPVFVRERILQVIAIMLKRESVDDMGTSLTQLLDQVENLVLTGDHSRRILGCHLMAAIMLEFAITFKSSDVGLPFEDHFKAKKRFQDMELKKIFHFCCRALSGLVANDVLLDQQGTALLKSLLTLAESVLTWNFVSSQFLNRIIGVFEAASEVDQNVSLKLQPAWRDVILDGQVVDLFYTLYWKIRLNPQLAHHGLTCLVQLGSLNGVIFPNKEVRLQYVTNFIQNFIKLVTNADVLDREALGIANILFKVILFNPLSVLMCLPDGLIQTFLEQITKLTCYYAQGAVAEEDLCREDRLFMEGFDRLMETWLLIFLAPEKVAPELLINVTKQIFNIYVELHITPPEGTRAGGREMEAEELAENDEVDRIRFQAQLQTLGVMGRYVPHHSLPMLAQLLEDRTRRLGALLQKLHEEAVTISDNSAVLLLFEDIHWLILISGFVVSMHCERETNTVPMELMQYSIKQGADQNVSVQVFGSPHADITGVANGDSHSDHVIRLVAAHFRLGHLLKQSMNAKLLQLLSPEVASSLLWFEHRWVETYLLLDEELYADLSPALLACHGRDSDGGVWASRFILDQALAHLMHFHSERTVLEDAVKLLISLVQNRDKRSALVKSEGFAELLQLLPHLPSYVKPGVYQALTVGGMAVVEGSADTTYWVQVLQPLQERFKALVAGEDAKRRFHEETVKTELLDILESLIGVANGTRLATVSTIFSCAGPILAELPSLLAVCHNYQAVVETILRLFGEVAKSLVTFLKRKEVNSFYQICLQLIQIYAKFNSGRLSLESDAQEDSFQDVLLLLDLLSALLSKDLVDLAPPGDAGDENEPLVTASEVCLNALNLIMPLMTTELLKFPTLCFKYYKLLHYLSDLFGGKILQLPEPLLKSVLSSVELGLTSFGPEVVLPCCHFLKFLAVHICQMVAVGELANPVLRPFLKLLMELILSRQISLESVPNASSTLFALMCCYKQDYEDLVRQLLTSQPDPAIAERLARAFNQLTAQIELTPARVNSMRFCSKFENFVTEVHGFLHVK